MGRYRAELEAKFDRILAALKASKDPAVRVQASLLPPREVVCPRCGKRHEGRAKKGYCLWCLNQMGWAKGGAEAFRARNAGVKPRGYEGDEPAIQPMSHLGHVEDPYALDADGDQAGGAGAGGHGSVPGSADGDGVGADAGTAGAGSAAQPLPERLPPSGLTDWCGTTHVIEDLNRRLRDLD